MSKSDKDPTGVKLLATKQENIRRAQDEKQRTQAQMQVAQAIRDDKMRSNTSQSSLPDTVFLNMEVKKNEEKQHQQPQQQPQKEIEEIESNQDMSLGAKLIRKGAETLLTGIYEEEEGAEAEAAKRAKEKEMEKEKRFSRFARKLFSKKGKDKDKPKSKFYETTDYRSSGTSKSGSGATISSSGANDSFDEAMKFPLPPELTDEIDGQRLDMSDVKRISDLKDRRKVQGVGQKPPERQEIGAKPKSKKDGSKATGVVVDDVGSEIITKTVGESESERSYRSDDRESQDNTGSRASLTGSAFQNSEVFIKAHTTGKIENVEESKESIN